MRNIFLLAVAGLAAFASANKKKDEVVRVSIAAESGSMVKITVKNISRRKIDFFQRGTVMDDNPVHKLEVTSAYGTNPAVAFFESELISD
jgi:hypothetical protein